MSKIKKPKTKTIGCTSFISVSMKKWFDTYNRYSGGTVRKKAFYEGEYNKGILFVMKRAIQEPGYGEDCLAIVKPNEAREAAKALIKYADWAESE